MKKLLWFVLCFLPVWMFAQSPFDGTWKTNMTASKLSQKPYEFSVNNGMYDCESCSPKIKNLKADGQGQPVTGQKGGKPEFDQTRSASQDGKTLTVSSTNYLADGSAPYKSESKWTRVSKGPAGSNGTSGSWRIQSVSGDNAGLVTTWKGDGNTLSMSTPTGVSWEAKLDAKGYPVKGTYANETVSVKPLGDRSMEVTYRRDGQVESVDKITVSADGKQMTTVSDNKRFGRVSTFVDEK